MPPNPPSKRVASSHAAWRKSLDLIAINLIDYGAIYCQNISARQCHNSPTKISVRDYRTKIDTQPTLTKNEITFGPISIPFCTKSLLKAQK